MNAIVVVLRISGATYCNSRKAHVFRRLRSVQRVLNHLHTGLPSDNEKNPCTPEMHSPLVMSCTGSGFSCFYMYGSFEEEAVY